MPDNDAPDEVRDAAFREAQHAWYLRQLTERGIPFHLATDTIAQRGETISKLLRPGP